MAVSGVAAVTRGNAQAEREREAEWDTYNTVFYGNPHGADGLAPRSMHPHRLLLAEINAPREVRAHPEYDSIRRMLEEMYDLLKQHQSTRYRLWSEADGARGLAKAVTRRQFSSCSFPIRSCRCWR